MMYWMGKPIHKLKCFSDLVKKSGKPLTYFAFDKNIFNYFSIYKISIYTGGTILVVHGLLDLCVVDV